MPEPRKYPSFAEFDPTTLKKGQSYIVVCNFSNEEYLQDVMQEVESPEDEQEVFNKMMEKADEGKAMKPSGYSEKEFLQIVETVADQRGQEILIDGKDTIVVTGDEDFCDYLELALGDGCDVLTDDYLGIINLWKSATTGVIHLDSGPGSDLDM